MAIGKRKRVVIPKRELPPVSSDGKYIVRYRIISEDRNRTSHWSPTYSVSAMPLYPLSVNIVKLTGDTATTIYATWSETRPIESADGLDINISSYDVFAKHNFEVSHKELLNNVATITTKHLSGIAVGDLVTVSGIDATFNGTYTVTATNSIDKTISYSKVAANVDYTGSSGTASSAFIFQGSSTLKAYSFIATTGAESVEIAIQVESQYNEKVDNLEVYSSSPILL